MVSITPDHQPERCADCDAVLRERDEWCPRCLTKIPEAEPERQFAHPDAFIGPRMQIRYSRRARTDVSYGLWGRILATVVLAVGPGVLLLWYAGPFGIVFVVAAWPILLPAIWKKTPVRETQDRQ